MTPGTTLLVTFVALTFALIVSLWGLGMFLQGFLYNSPAGRLPLRAAAGGLILAGFLTFWVYVNTRSEGKDKYGTVFMSSAETRKEFLEFDAVRQGKSPGQEKTATFKRTGKAAPFLEVPDGKPFTLTTPDYVTVAMDVKEGDGKARFDADLDDKGKYKPGRVFRDRSRRYIEFGNTNTPSDIVAVSRGAVLAALAINLMNYLVWFAVFWPVMRFTVGHSVGLAAVFGSATMLILMPLLFEKNQVPQHREPAKVEQAK